MARVQADPITAALAHPTRRNVYSILCETDEMSTVQLQTSLDVDRYNLYHHLKKLASIGLVENHRDVGRARWWKVASRVEIPGIITAVKPTVTKVKSNSSPGEIGALLESENGIHLISLDGSRDKIGAKLLFEQLADDLGIEVDIPWNFVPGTIALIEQDK